MVTRRSVLHALGACALLPRAAFAEAQAEKPRIVALSWELTEMLLALGIAPVGLAAPDWYTSGFVDPPLPKGVVDIGLLYQPNYDLLYELRPDLLIITPGHASVRASFERIAPTLTLGMYMSDPQPYRAMRREAMTLAQRIGRVAQASALLSQTDDVIAQSHRTLAMTRHAPVCIAQLVDDRHLRIFGAGSMFDEILVTLGLVNAATRDGVMHAESGIVELERLAQMNDSNLLWIDGRAVSSLERNPLWRALPFSQERRTAALPVIASTGALVSVQRFARAVAQTAPTLWSPHAV